MTRTPTTSLEARLERRQFLSLGATVVVTNALGRPASGPMAASSARPSMGAAMEKARVPGRLRRVAAETPYWLQASGTPGLTVALLEGGKASTVFCFGATDLEGMRPVTEATIFQAASLSKQALLYAALETVEAGKLDLDRPLTRYLEKPLDAPEADLDRITARHVLTHTTGWPNWPQEGKPLKPVRPLGQWGYSGAGFVYLQKALESIWSEPATHYLRRLVLDPLGMHASDFVWRDEYQASATRGFDPGDGIVKPWHPVEVNGASSLHTTAREFALLLEAYLRRDLRERHPEAFHQQVKIDARLGWSLGWGTAGDVLWQWGHSEGFKTFAALLPERARGIVVLTNSASGQRINREWINAWLELDLPAFFFKYVDL